MSTPDQFVRDIQAIMVAARRGKIKILEKTVEAQGPNVAFFLVRFKPLR
jgi:hypothetical protein